SGTPSAPHAPARRVAEAHVPQEALGLPDHAERRSDGNAEMPADGCGRREGASRTEVLTTTDLRHIVDPDDIAATHALASRLAHVSPSLRDRDVTRAVEKLSLMAQGIGGGTRIGESLATFNRWHARRVINSRTAVMIVSDGYDTGEPSQLGEEMRRLRRRCKKTIWL